LTDDSADTIGPRVQIIYLFPSHFDLLLLNAIDEGLAVFGESARQAIYHLIQEKSHIHHMEIPEKLQTFHESLTELFGLGAEVIEKTILAKLREKMGIQFKEHENRTLADYINEYRNCVSQ
jgi:hypothetical protein